MSDRVDVWFLNNLGSGSPEKRNMSEPLLCVVVQPDGGTLRLVLMLFLLGPCTRPTAFTSNLCFRQRVTSLGCALDVHSCTCPGRVQTSGARPDGPQCHSKPSHLLRIGQENTNRAKPHNLMLHNASGHVPDPPPPILDDPAGFFRGVSFGVEVTVERLMLGQPHAAPLCICSK